MSSFSREERRLEEWDREDELREHQFEKNDVPMSQRYPQTCSHCKNPTTQWTAFCDGRGLRCPKCKDKP